MANPEQRSCPRCGTLTHGYLCNPCIADDMDAMDQDDDDSADDYDDCALMANGQCLKAGSEECDWECGRWRTFEQPEDRP